MKIFIVCSKHFYDKVFSIVPVLQQQDHEVILPNSYDNPAREKETKELGNEIYVKWKTDMLRLSEEQIKKADAILVLNFTKNGVENYIGGATFIEVFKAWELGKKIFFYNPLPENIFTDELRAFLPLVINGDVSKIK